MLPIQCDERICREGINEKLQESDAKMSLKEKVLFYIFHTFSFLYIIGALIRNGCFNSTFYLCLVWPCCSCCVIIILYICNMWRGQVNVDPPKWTEIIVLDTNSNTLWKILQQQQQDVINDSLSSKMGDPHLFPGWTESSRSLGP